MPRPKRRRRRASTATPALSQQAQQTLIEAAGVHIRRQPKIAAALIQSVEMVVDRHADLVEALDRAPSKARMATTARSISVAAARLMADLSRRNTDAKILQFLAIEGGDPDNVRQGLALLRLAADRLQRRFSGIDSRGRPIHSGLRQTVRDLHEIFMGHGGQLRSRDDLLEFLNAALEHIEHPATRAKLLALIPKKVPNSP